MDKITEDSSAETKYYGMWALARIMLAIGVETPPAGREEFWKKVMRIDDLLREGLLVLWQLMSDEDIE